MRQCTNSDRNPWRLVLGGNGSDVYRSSDGGSKWERLTGGLPDGTIGRIGIDIYQKNPNILYAVVENLNARPEGVPRAIDACTAARSRRAGRAARAAPQPAGGRGGQGRGGATGGPIGNEIYRTDDGGKTWRKTNSDSVDVAGGKAPYSFNQIKINPNNPDHVIVTSDTMYSSTDGGKTWSCSNTNGFFRGVFGDFRTMWWDAEDSNRIMIGSDGGVNVSYDGGRTADYFLNLRIGEMYAIGVDMDDPYNVYGGMQDHDSWKGPSNSISGRITLEHWTTVGPGDGMYNQVDPTDSRWVYNTREMGNHGRFDQQTGQRTVIAPPAPPGGPPLRYIWQTPIVLSPHNPQIVYAGSQFLFRSLNRGDGWEAISGDLTTNDPAKCGRGSGNVPYCAITTISESPRRAGVIWIGTDDGKVQVTQNHGAAWTDVTALIAATGGPADRYVSRVFASPHDASTAFVVEDRLPSRRFHTVPVPDDRSRQDVDVDRRRTASLAHQRRRAGQEKRESADRRQRRRCLGVDRRGQEMGATEGEPADGRRSRPDDPSARRRSRARHLRPRDLGRRYHAAAGADAGGARQAGYTSSTSSRARGTASPRSATTICTATNTSRSRTSPRR